MVKLGSGQVPVDMWSTCSTFAVLPNLPTHARTRGVLRLDSGNPCREMLMAIYIAAVATLTMLAAVVTAVCNVKKL